MRGALLGVQIGQIQRMVMPENAKVDFQHPFWTSGIFKSPVPAAVQVTPSGIAGDQQADLEHHGGPDNVVLAYDAAHYPGWQCELALPDLPFGSFGENFTVSGFSDDTACIGDVWQVGPQLQLQVTQARQPCFKLARRLRQPHIVKRVRETGRGGWYLRVLRDGPAQTGMPIERLAHPHPEWPVAAAVQVMYARKLNPARTAALAAIPELSTRWKRELLADD